MTVTAKNLHDHGNLIDHTLDLALLDKTLRDPVI